ncbi:hypothetical protein RhiirC2_778234 [Rhizophagus irregularis]|uniref:Endonuclease/exonuclease/phosphatase domain-containing protein n=1 Tax=Rhizophagus irregularis TaxID=588596 RepID=A0A2N1NCI0_9GLOM|nr:hypothetical protein RhiirC2_778234 [Rhizophagus irregularis]
MGIAPSVERFEALEGYTTKTDEERLEIIKNAGFEITENDATISKFLGLDNPIFSVFIRGIITICIDINNVERNKEFNKHIEEFKQISNDMLEGKQREMNEMVMKMSEEWRKKEAYYFGNTNEKKHLIRTEHGTIDIEDKEKMLNYRNLSEEDFKENIRRENENVLSDYTPSTPSDTTEEDFKTTIDRRYGKTLQPIINHTQRNTNKISRMHDQNKYRNYADPLDQSITMAITSDYTMGGYDKISKESRHKPKKEEDLKYFAGLLSVKIGGTEKERQLVELFNEHKLLEYHVNTLGRTTKNGNQYTYVGFFTEKAREIFIKVTRIAKEIGEFRSLQWLDKLDQTLTLSVTGIDKNAHDMTEVEKTIEKKFGKIKEVISRMENYGKINMKIQVELRCTEDELMNTWGIIVNEKIIKVEPLNYKVHEIRKRETHSATIMDIPCEIEEEDLTEQLYKTGARYWYREDNKNENFKYSIRVYFKDEREQKTTITTTTTIIEEKKELHMDTVMEEITRAIEEIDINSKHQDLDVRYVRKTVIEKKNVTLTETTNDNKEDKDQMRTQVLMETTKDDSMETTIEEDTMTEDNNKVTEDTMEIISTNNTRIEFQEATTTDTKENNNNNKIILTDNEMEIITTNTMDVTTSTTDTGKDMKDTPEVTDVTEGTQTNNKQNKTFYEEGTLMGRVDNVNNMEENNLENNKNITKNKNQRKNNVKRKEIKNNNNKKEEKNHLKLGCLNVRGLNDNKKQLEIKKIIEKENWDISLLTEMKLKENKGKFVYKGWAGYDIINNSFNENNSKSGTVLILKQNISDRKYKIEKIDGHAIKVEILFRKQKNITIIGIYRPNDDKLMTNRINENITDWIQEAYKLDQDIIIMGDLNESASKAIKDKQIIKNLYNHVNILQVLQDQPFLCVDTWKSGELSSRIDYIFCNEDILKEIISHEVKDIKEEITDHKALTLKFKIQDKIKYNKRKYLKELSNQYKKIVLESEDWEELAELIEDNMINQDDQDLTRENIWDSLVLNYEREYNKMIKKKENDRKQNEETEGSNKIHDKQKNILSKITTYNKLAYLDNITFDIKKIIEKTKKQEWRDYTRRTFSNNSHKLSEKQFSENLIINSWDNYLSIDNLRTHQGREKFYFTNEDRGEKMRILYEEIINDNIELNIRKREIDLEEDIASLVQC